MSVPDTPEHSPSRRAERRRHRMLKARPRRRKIQALAAGGLVLGIGASGTVAAWTDQEFGTGTFEAGQFNIEVTTDGDWESTNTILFEAHGMFPGATVYSPVYISTSPATTVAGDLTVATEDDAGTLTPYLQYRAVAVELSSRDERIACDELSFSPEVDYHYVFGSETEYISMADASTSEALTLAAGGNNVWAYCFEVELRQDAPNEVQGETADHTWTFNAESRTDAPG